MHMFGEPKTMQRDPRYTDVVAEVGGYLVAQAATLEAAGVARERIAIDPGIGFGKTPEHNLELLRRLPELASLGYPLVIGASRKRFIGEFTNVEDPAERFAGSVTAALFAVHAARMWCAFTMSRSPSGSPCRRLCSASSSSQHPLGVLLFHACCRPSNSPSRISL
jgi:dihydropteroate synthase